MNVARRHWQEYAMEGALLGLFMIAACSFATLLEHPASPANRALPDGNVRRLLMGLAMGLTAVSLIYSPWGQQSGAHMNPSLTLTYLRLGKIERADALGYVAGQFLGGVTGVLLMRATLGMLVGHPAVRFAATAPGAAGPAAAFLAEFAISFVLMAVVLVATNSSPRLARATPLFCGALVATYISLEAPLSGMSMNPVRSFASALAAWQWRALWIYFTAPPLGMLAAAEVYVGLRGAHRVLCAKLNHYTARRCIFRCNFAALGEGGEPSPRLPDCVTRAARAASKAAKATTLGSPARAGNEGAS
jgi:aquaporin Z